MHKEPLHWTVQHLNGGSRVQEPGGSSEAAAAPSASVGMGPGAVSGFGRMEGKMCW